MQPCSQGEHCGNRCSKRSHRSTVRSVVTPSSVRGVAALEVLTMSREPSALTNQVQEEPKLLIAESVNFALNSSKEPNAALDRFCNSASWFAACFRSKTVPVERGSRFEQRY